MPRSYHVIINSRAGTYTPERANIFLGKLESRGVSLSVSLVTDPVEATRQAQRICRSEESPVIIVGGGDDTIHGVINGLTYGTATLAVAPFGSTNLLARELGITSLDDAAERIIAGATRYPAIGLLQNDKSKWYFMFTAGVGCDGYIYESVLSGGTNLPGKGAYLLAALRRFALWERESLQIFVDGMRIDCHSVIVCNAAHYGGGAVLAPEADLFAPEFQVVCVKDDRRRSYLKLLANTLMKRYPDIPEVRRFAAVKLIITGSKAAHADGHFVTYSPVRVSCVERFVQFIV